jgi:hypothetical protein
MVELQFLTTASVLRRVIFTCRDSVLTIGRLPQFPGGPAIRIGICKAPSIKTEFGILFDIYSDCDLRTKLGGLMFRDFRLPIEMFCGLPVIGSLYWQHLSRTITSRRVFGVSVLLIFRGKALFSLTSKFTLLELPDLSLSGLSVFTVAATATVNGSVSFRKKSAKKSITPASECHQSSCVSDDCRVLYSAAVFHQALLIK